MKRVGGTCRSSKATRVLSLLVLGGALLAGENTRSPDTTDQGPSPNANAELEVGVASYYAHKYHGRTTANGEMFDMHALTAAHLTYRFGTRVKVTHMENGRSVIVRINDRGPFVKGRVIDLSLAAAEELDMIESGLARVSLEILDWLE
jgi:rare lipoprotein A